MDRGAWYVVGLILGVCLGIAFEQERRAQRERHAFRRECERQELVHDIVDELDARADERAAKAPPVPA